MQSLPFPRSRVPKGNLKITLPRIYPRRIGLAVLFLMTSRAFYFLPGMSMPSEFWNVLNFFFLAFIYTAWKAKAGERFLAFEIYILLMMLAMPVWSAIMSLHVFDQPLFYGILTQRTMILGTGALSLLAMYRFGWIDTSDCREALVILAWGTLLVYVGWSILTHGQQELTSNGAQIKLNVVFIEIGFLYYGLIGFNRKSKLHYLLAAAFLAYLVSYGERALLLSVVGAYGLFILLRGSFARLAVFIPAAIFGLVALVGVMFLVDAEYITTLGERYVEAFTVVTTGQTTQDVSANLRLEETAVALPYIQNSPVMGNGDISNQWHGGYQGVLQAYFYPTDIGVFGIVYMYGIVGLFLFLLQFWWARKYAKQSTQGADTPPMVDAVCAFLLAYGVQSASTGAFAFNWQIGVTLIAYLYIVAESLKARVPVRSRRSLFYSGDLAGLQRSP